MAEEKDRILVDRDLRPAYYDDFHCLAAGCKLSCCKGWNIPFNKKDYLSLKRQKGSPKLNTLLESSVKRIRRGPLADKMYGEFDMGNGVCPLLGEDGLCTLQIEKGHGTLPDVCRRYPRNEANEVSGYLERSLSPSCEGVLELLWGLPEGIEFRSGPLPETAHKWVNWQGKNILPIWFSVVREWCIDLLQDRRFTLPQRILLMGLGLKELADGETDIQSWTERAMLLPSVVDPAQMLPHGEKEQAIVLMGCVRILFSIQSTDQVFLKSRAELFHSLEVRIQQEEKEATASISQYRRALENYEIQFKGYEYFMENLMVNVFFQLHLPNMDSRESLWKSYVNLCNLYSFYHFMAVMSCREGIENIKSELYKLIVLTSRALIQNSTRQGSLRDEFFKNDSATLAHMAILLGG